MADEDRFKLADDRFAEIHRKDPRGHAATYHETLASWVDRLAPDSSVALRLAARSQHIGRYEMPRSAFPDGAAGYKKWRSECARRHAEIAAQILRDVGFEDATAARVGELIMKKGFKTDPESQTLQDAVCLTFLELELEPFATKHDDEKVLDILRKTLKKMSAEGQEAATKLARGLPLRLTSLLARA
jgi:hypothetical protein